MDPTEICTQGRTLYETRLRSLLEPTCRGQYLILDVATGDYVVTSDYAPALVEQQRRHEGRLQYVTRIGERALMRRSGRRT